MTGELSGAEQEELEDWLASDVRHREFAAELYEGHLNGEVIRQVSPVALEELKQSMRSLITDRIDFAAPPTRGTVVHRVHFLRRGWFRYAAAIVLLVGVSGYFYYTNSAKKHSNVPHQTVAVKNDILPGTNKAILTLSNGKRVELGSAASETILDGTLAIANNNGALSYAAIPSSPRSSRLRRDSRAPDEGIAYNTMTTPRGGQYKLTLSDGTRVWLNAASSITYPTVFTGATRTVSINGEAYFEVEKNAKQPFIVKTNTDQIEVLGTAFNINAYRDENAVKTTLISGSVKVGPHILKPGQAVQNNLIVATNVQQDVAWKNGVFDFNGADLQKVMRQIARWYNVEVKYAGRIPQQRFVGQLSRDLTLQQILETLTDMNIRYTLDKRTLTIQ